MTATAALAPSLRPSLRLLGTEPARACVDALRLLRSPPVARVGDGHAVVVFPGLATDGGALWPLRRHLKQAGFNAMDWGQGRNIGPRGELEAWLAALATSVRERAGPGPISLVGWSLGGFYARELAKRMPDIRRVITIGTPFSGSPQDTNVGWLFTLLNGRRPPVDAALRERLAEPPPVPTVSLYSRADGVVAWQACRHRGHWAQVKDVEVQASHMGMGWSPEVLGRVTKELARAG
jgi:predicted alpha/beta hydrolase family esterase